jgi:hypothetical protein
VGAPAGERQSVGLKLEAHAEEVAMIHQPAISIVVSFGLASTLFTQVAHGGTGRSAIENMNCPATEVHSSFSQPARLLMWR